jgi:hypothetical protein
VAGCGRYAIGRIRHVKGYRRYDFAQAGSEWYLDRRRFFFGLIFNVVTVENLLFPRSMRRERQAQVSKNESIRRNLFPTSPATRDAASCKRFHRDVHQHHGQSRRRLPKNSRFALLHPERSISVEFPLPDAIFNFLLAVDPSVVDKLQLRGPTKIFGDLPNTASNYLPLRCAIYDRQYAFLGIQ